MLGISEQKMFLKRSWAGYPDLFKNIWRELKDMEIWERFYFVLFGSSSQRVQLGQIRMS
jgi:hypothetical protein